MGIFPDSEAVDLICDLQSASRDQFKLRGKFRPREILHVTMHHIADYPDMPTREIEKIGQACLSACAGQGAIGVTFDHVKSFRGRPGNQPFVLVNPSGNESLMALHQRLITELIKRSLAKNGDFNFVPHVTLLYDRETVTQQPVAPISWRAREIVLVLSHLGETRYEKLRSWPLGE